MIKLDTITELWCTTAGLKYNSDDDGVIIVSLTLLPRGDQGILGHVFDPSGYLRDGEILYLGWNWIMHMTLPYPLRI